MGKGTTGVCLDLELRPGGLTDVPGFAVRVLRAWRLDGWEGHVGFQWLCGGERKEDVKVGCKQQLQDPGLSPEGGSTYQMLI